MCLNLTLKDNKIQTKTSLNLNNSIKEPATTGSWQLIHGEDPLPIAHVTRGCDDYQTADPLVRNGGILRVRVRKHSMVSSVL